MSAITKESTMDSPLSFGCDMISAIPECVCMYLSSPDILIPNTLWKQSAGEMNRMCDLARLKVDVNKMATDLRERPDHTHYFDCAGYNETPGMLRLIVTPVASHPGVYILCLRDETEVRRVEQLRKDFIANVSHELRTPLTAVKGYVETLMEPKFLTMDRVKEFLPVIFEHTERLHNLMLDLLSLSRLENPYTHIELSPLLLADELQHSVDATTPLAAMKNLEIDLSLPDEGLRVMANAEHMERILVNLLDNAIKYSQPNGNVSVWTERKGEYVWTHVRDEGPGIAAEELPRVFERFYRTRSALSSRARGTGLGLAIAKHIIQQLGGEIKVQSTLGKGSHFYFSLKIAGKNDDTVILGMDAVPKIVAV